MSGFYLGFRSYLTVFLSENTPTILFYVTKFGASDSCVVDATDIGGRAEESETPLDFPYR